MAAAATMKPARPLEYRRCSGAFYSGCRSNNTSSRWWAITSWRTVQRVFSLMVSASVRSLICWKSSTPSRYYRKSPAPASLHPASGAAWGSKTPRGKREQRGRSFAIRQLFAESLPCHIVQVCISYRGKEALSKKLVVQDINNGDQW
jgi:hypothetical protein